MCEVGEGLGKGPDEIGRMPIGDLSTWAAHFAAKKKLERKAWDERFGQVCFAVALFAGHTADWPPESFFPSLRDPADSSPAGAGSRRGCITGTENIERALLTHCALSGGINNAKGSDHEKVQDR